MAFELRPNLDKNKPQYFEVRRAQKARKSEEFLKCLERTYEEYKITDTLACEFVEAAYGFEDECGWNALALYLEAFGDAGRESSSVQNYLKVNSKKQTVLSYLESRPVRLRNLTFVGRLKQRWGMQKHCGPNASVNSEFGAIDLIVLSEGATTDHLIPIIDRLEEKTTEVVVFDAKLESRITKELSERQLNKLKFVRLQKVDIEADPIVFGNADNLTAKIIDRMSLIPKESFEQADFDRYKLCLSVLIRDALSPFMRFEYALQKARERNSPKTIVCVGNDETILGVASMFDAQLFRVVQKRGAFKFVEVSQSPLEELFDRMSVAKEKPDTRVFHFPRRRLKEKAVVVYCKSADRQSIGNIEALVPELIKRRPIIAELGWCTHESARKNLTHIFDGALGRLIDNGELGVAWVKKRPVSSHWHTFGLRRLLDDAIKHVLQLGYDENGRPGLFTLLLSYSRLKEAVREIQSVSLAWDDVIGSSHSVLLCPGRNVTALAMISAAKANDVPSFELQNGTVSATGRFVPSCADTMLVNDNTSYKTFVESMSVPTDRLKLVGSPRIDAGLKFPKRISEATARVISFGNSVSNSVKVILLATQPLDNELSFGLFSVFTQLMQNLDENFKLIIRPHPMESASKIQAYSDKLKEAGICESRILTSRPGNIELRAVDAVFTYYSTIGLEALYLEKPVFVVTPPNVEKLPFDLCNQGAEGPYDRYTPTLKERLLSRLNANETIPAHWRNAEEKRTSVELISELVIDQ